MAGWGVLLVGSGDPDEAFEMAVNSAKAAGIGVALGATTWERWERWERCHPSFERTWNDLGNLASIGYPQCTFAACTAKVPRTVSSTYTNGFLTGVTGYASSISYHPNGQVNQVTRANNVIDTHYKDPYHLLRPNKIDAKLGTTVVWNSGVHVYDGAGNMTKAGNAYFAYDRASRVQDGRLYLGAGAGGTAVTFDHAYDGFGNLLSLTTNSTSRPTPTSYATNRLTGSVTYDAAGNLTSWNGNTYQYDRFHQMTRVASGTEIWLYMYDADDERFWAFKEGANPRFDRFVLRDLGGKVLRTYEVGGTAWTWSWKEDHVYRGTTLLASVTPSGTTHLHTDHLPTGVMPVDLRDSLRDVLCRWSRGEVDERTVHQKAEGLWEELSGVPEFPRQDRRSIPIEVLSHLEILDQKLVLPEDIPEILTFLGAPPGQELEAWNRWELYWDSRDYDERLERLKDNPNYSKLGVTREPEKVY